jgi:hypothetical protein
MRIAQTERYLATLWSKVQGAQTNIIADRLDEFLTIESPKSQSEIEPSA